MMMMMTYCFFQTLFNVILFILRSHYFLLDVVDSKTGVGETAYCWDATPWRLVKSYLCIYQMAGVTLQRIWNFKWLVFQSFRLRFLRVLNAPILSAYPAYLILVSFTTIINYEASVYSVPYSQLPVTVPVLSEDSPENFVISQTHDMAWFRMPVFALGARIP